MPRRRAGFELLATGGRFVEIGKRDVYGNTRLGMYPFRRNLTFYYVDLALMSLSHPERVGTLLRTVYQLVADGELPPARHTDYPLAEAATAIRVMSAAQHTGKLLLDVDRTGRSRVVVPPEQAPAFRRDGAYLDHRRPWRSGVVPRREDGRRGLRTHRADVAFAADGAGTGENRVHSLAGRRCRRAVR